MARRIRRLTGDTTVWDLVLLEDGAAVDLATASAAVIYIREQGGSTNKVDGDSLTIQDAANGVVRFAPDASDVDTVGEYAVQVKVTFTDGKVGYWDEAEAVLEAAFG